MDYYNFFYSLEDKFHQISKFVEIERRNFHVNSGEIAMTLMSACSEFEVVSKKLCSLLNPNFNHKTKMPGILAMIQKECPNLLSQKVSLTYFKIELKPLKIEKGMNIPFWWRAYNNVKHNRSENYRSANIINLINSLSALSIVNHYYLWRLNHAGKSLDAARLSMMNRYPIYFQLEGINYGKNHFTDDVFDI